MQKWYNMKKKGKIMICILIILLCPIIDQFTKVLAINHLKDISTMPIINNVFHLTYMENTGAAFSMLNQNTKFLTIITIIFILILLFFLYKEVKGNNNIFMKIGVSFIIGGALGNLIDRVMRSYVVDFFDLRIIHFAIFNVADLFVTIGAIFVLYVLIFDKSYKI